MAQQKPAVGWIGTGIMGSSMAGHLLSGGYELHVYNRSRKKAEGLIQKGAVWHDTPRDVTAASTVVFSIVGYPGDVREVYFGPDGVFAGVGDAPAGEGARRILVDMTTSEPTLAREIAEEAQRRGVDALDAPVSGGDTGARNGELAIMIGGDAAAVERVMPLMERMGTNIRHLGAAGAGQHTKMCNQILISTTMIGTVESLLYAQAAGLDQNAVIDVIGRGAASSWSINNLGTRIANGNFDPGFMIRHFIKDMGIALAEAQRMNLALPGLAMAHQFYIAATAKGWDGLGTQALYRVLAEMNGQS
jgi:3-hydroxyisobutyrate dehydrogenase